MTEQELRALVREAIARHVDGGSAGHVHAEPSSAATAQPIAFFRQHASHGRFVLPAGDGRCLIEPAVACNHCGYCTSYGH